MGKDGEAEPRERRLRRWSELSATERGLFAPQVLVQAAVRLAVFFLALLILGPTDTGDGVLGGQVTGREGVATVRACSPGSTLGIEWYRSCDTTIRWGDGEVEQHTFETIELGANSAGSTVGVLEREGGTKWGGANRYPALDLPERYQGYASTLFLAFGVLFLAFPYWYRLGTADERAERRRRAKVRARPALVVASGYWLIVAGGMGWPLRPPEQGLSGWGPLTWPYWLVVAVGVVVLGTGLVLVRYRQVKGYPPVPPRPSLGGVGRLAAAALILLVSTIGLVDALTSGAEGLPMWLFRLALPVALLVAGARVLLVWSRRRRLPRKDWRNREPVNVGEGQKAT